MDAVVKEEENMIKPKKEVEESVEFMEPKVEMIDEQNVKKEEIDEDEYQHLIPYEYRDYLEQHREKEPENSRKRYAIEKSPFEKKAFECEVCLKSIMLDCFARAEKHAATHTNLIRFICPAEYCDFKCYHPYKATNHMRSKHNMIHPSVRDVVRRELSDEEKEHLRRVMEDCFPELPKPTYKVISQPDKAISGEDGSRFSCQVCNLLPNYSKSTAGRRSHAMTHTDIMLYKCTVQDCDFKANQRWSVPTHQRIKHGVASETLSRLRIQLTMEQELAIERMVIRCFPELKDDSEYRIGMINRRVKENERKLIAKTPINRRHSCDVCHKLLSANALTSFDLRRNHALTHTDIMLYKCSKQTCNFKSITHFSISSHQKWIHNMNDMPVERIELTNEQAMEIRRMMFQCFPEWNNE